MSRRRLMGPPVRLGRVAIAAQAFLAVVIVGYLLHQDGVRLPFTGGGDWQVEVAFRDAGGLTSDQHAAVLVAGVPEGRVESVRYEHGVAIARLALHHDALGVVRADAVARVEPRSALNDPTVNIAPGTRAARALGDGARLAPSQAAAPVQLDRVVDVLDADTRSQVAVLLDQLATGLRGRAGDLRTDVARMAPLLDSSRSLAAALDRRRALLTQLVDSLDTLAGVAARHQSAVGEVVRTGRRTLAASAREQAPLAASVRALPGALVSLDRALTATRALADPLRPALDRLAPMTATLPRTLASVRAATPAFARLVTNMGALERDGVGPLTRLAAIAPQLGRTASVLDDPTRRLAPIVRAVDAHRDGIGQLGERFSGVLSTNDANGTILRGLGDFEPFNPADVGEPGSTPAQRAAAAAKAVRALEGVCMQGSGVACLVRYLIPGLPGAVRGGGG